MRKMAKSSANPPDDDSFEPLAMIHFYFGTFQLYHPNI